MDRRGTTPEPAAPPRRRRRRAGRPGAHRHPAGRARDRPRTPAPVDPGDGPGGRCLRGRCCRRRHRARDPRACRRLRRRAAAGWSCRTRGRCSAPGPSIVRTGDAELAASRRRSTTTAPRPRAGCWLVFSYVTHPDGLIVLRDWDLRSTVPSPARSPAAGPRGYGRSRRGSSSWTPLTCASRTATAAQVALTWTGRHCGARPDPPSGVSALPEGLRRADAATSGSGVGTSRGTAWTTATSGRPDTGTYSQSGAVQHRGAAPSCSLPQVASWAPPGAEQRSGVRRAAARLAGGSRRPRRSRRRCPRAARRRRGTSWRGLSATTGRVVRSSTLPRALGRGRSGEADGAPGAVARVDGDVLTHAENAAATPPTTRSSCPVTVGHREPRSAWAGGCQPGSRSSSRAGSAVVLDGDQLALLVSAGPRSPASSASTLTFRRSGPAGRSARRCR